MLKISVVDGDTYFWADGNIYKIQIDDLRRVYCAALGLEMWNTTIQQEIDAVNRHTVQAVDMPEDVLKVKKIMELNGVL